MTDKDAPNTLLTSLLNVQKALGDLKLGRDAEGQIQSRSYKYLTLEKIHEKVLPILSSYGLCWVTIPTGSEEAPGLRYRLIHAASGEDIGGVMPIFLGADRTSKAYGSALSYAARYAIMRILGIAPAGEDDDGEAASKPSKAPVRPSKPLAPIVPPKEGDAFPTVVKEDNPDRLLGDEEKALVQKAIRERKQPEALILASVGAESLDDLTVAQGRDLFRRLNG
ncbi:MAG TPA: ERF family protein [Terriglobia bacterium]|nr:ERF family protein [Terriglobia bacterium]